MGILFTTQLWPLVIVKILFQLNLLGSASFTVMCQFLQIYISYGPFLWSEA